MRILRVLSKLKSPGIASRIVVEAKMPRVFLVKNMRKRNWYLLPDSVQEDICIPVSYLPGCYGQEGCEDTAVRLPFSSCSPQSGNTLTDPHSNGLAVQLQEPSSKCYMRTHRPPYIRSKIKNTMGEMPIEESSTKSSTSITPTCPICFKTFSNAQVVKRHLRSHSNSKMYSCEYCEKGFNDTFDLKRHVRTHTGVRPFQCTACEKAFTQRCSLEVHLKTIHGVCQQYAFKERRNKLYVCEECGLTAHTQEGLTTHFQVKHPGSKTDINQEKPKATTQSGRQHIRQLTSLSE